MMNVRCANAALGESNHTLAIKAKGATTYTTLIDSTAKEMVRGCASRHTHSTVTGSEGGGGEAVSTHIRNFNRPNLNSLSVQSFDVECL